MGINRSAEDVAAHRGKTVLLLTLAFALYSVQACLQVAHHAPMTVTTREISNPLMNIVVWALWALVVTMWVYFTPSMLKRTAAEKAVLNDELVRRQRQVATQVALVVLVLGTITQVLGLWLFRLPNWWPLALLSTALVAGAVVFAVQDIRANG